MTRDARAPSPPRAYASARVEPRPTIPILHLDDDVVVVNKPPGLVVHRGWAREKVVVMTLARNAVGRHVYPVHRLDRQTSGALVFALHPEAARQLAEQFDGSDAGDPDRAEGVDKRYLALVRGRLDAPGVVDYAIPRSESGPRVPAVTEYRPIWVSPRYTLVEARPRTGRLHQIRKHFKHIGHPIVLDKKYGRGFFNDFARSEYGIDRMVLHARTLAFRHPRSEAPLSVRAPLVDLAPALERMGIPGAELA